MKNSAGKLIWASILNLTFLSHAFGGNWSDPATWGGSVPVAGQNVTIPTGTTVELDVSPPPLGIVEIQGTLRFQPANLTFTARHIVVHHGLLEVGTEAVPFTNKATIMLTGTDETENILIHSEATGTKGLVAMDGRIELHGARRSAQSFTVLTSNANVGATSINVASSTTGWRVGDQIVIAPSGFDPLEAEKVTITAISGSSITFAPALTFSHWGTIQTIQGVTVDQRAEVALLTRDIVIRGDDASLSSNFGGHGMIHHNGFIRAEGVEFYRMGQMGHRARYPLHWHFTGDGTGQYVKNCSVHDSFHRGIVTHMVDNVPVQDNVAYNVWSHTFIPAEDGPEINNPYRRNIAILTKRLEPLDRAFGTATDNPQQEGRPGCFWTRNLTMKMEDNVAAGCLNGMGFFYDLGGTQTGHPDFTGNKAHAIKGSIGGNDLYPPQTIGHALFLDDTTFDGRRVWKNFVAYKNKVAFWVESDFQVLENAILTDNSAAVVMLGGVLENSTVIGQTGNQIGGTAKKLGTNGITGAIHFPQDQGGLKPMNARNVTFIDQRDAAVTVVDDELADGSYFDSCTFINTQPVYFNLPTVSGKSGNILDMQGTATGTAGPAVISMKQLSSASVYRSTWKAYVTPLKTSSTIVTLDNAASSGVTKIGTWTTATTPTGFNGSNYLHDGNAGKGSKSVKFSPNVATAGWYQVEVRWPGGTAAATSVPLVVGYNGDSEAFSVNQQANAGTWLPISPYHFEIGTKGYVNISNTGTTGQVQADAVRLVRLVP